MSSPASRSPRPAVFLDRDGTVIEEVHYLSDPDLVRIVPGSGRAIRKLNEAGFFVVIATNQSGIARGLLDEDTLKLIHERMAALLAQDGAHIDHFEHCAHHPEYDGVETPRRKPEPGMLLDAAQTANIELSQSWMIGDAFRDVQAGKRAGTRAILVETGKGASQRAEAIASTEAPDYVAPALPEAIDWLLAQTSE